MVSSELKRPPIAVHFVNKTVTSVYQRSNRDYIIVSSQRLKILIEDSQITLRVGEGGREKEERKRRREGTGGERKKWEEGKERRGEKNFRRVCQYKPGL